MNNEVVDLDERLIVDSLLTVDKEMRDFIKNYYKRESFNHILHKEIYDIIEVIKEEFPVEWLCAVEFINRRYLKLIQH